jgi:anti-anti-sigma regulatory factor
MTTVPMTAAPKILRVDGVFDVGAARSLAAALTDVAAADVQIDLTHVREFHDFGVALLAQAVGDRHHAATVVLGLQEHHLRLLRYLAIDTGDANLSAGVELS